MIKSEKSQTVKRIFKAVGDVLVILLIIAAIFILYVALTAKKSGDDAATIFGKQFRIVVSESMEASDQTDVSNYKIKSIRVKSCIFIDLVPEDEPPLGDWYADVKIGDVLAFKYNYNGIKIITHRVIAIQKTESGYIITLQGDNKTEGVIIGTQTINTADSSAGSVIGKVTGQSYVLGAFICAFKTPIGLTCIVLIPCLAVIGLEVVRIVTLLSSEKDSAEKKSGNVDEKTTEKNAENNKNIDSVKNFDGVKVVENAEDIKNTESAKGTESGAVERKDVIAQENVIDCNDNGEEVSFSPEGENASRY